MDDGIEEENEKRNEQRGVCDLDDPEGTRGCGDEEIHGIHDNDCGCIEEAESASGVDCSDLFLQSYARLVQHALAVSCHSARALECAPVPSLVEQLRQLVRPQAMYAMGQQQLRPRRLDT